MTEYERHKLTEACKSEHICSKCEYEDLDEKTEKPCKPCFRTTFCYFVPKEDTTDD